MSTGAVRFEQGNGRGNAGSSAKRRPVFQKVSAIAELSADERELLRVVQEARDEWIETNQNFNYVHEEMLVDYYIYRIKACEARYTYFLKQIKEKGLTRYL